MTNLLLSDDLIFTSRIVGTGRDLGVAFRSAKSADVLLALARQTPPVCAIIDLNNPGLNIADVVAELQRLDPPPYVVGFGSHVDTATLRAARAAGCDLVMPRSQFVEEFARRPTPLGGRRLTLDGSRTRTPGRISSAGGQETFDSFSINILDRAP